MATDPTVSDYDGGDCCECTCVSTESHICGDEDNGGFACVDPSAPCVDDDDVTTVGYTDSDTGESPGTGDDYDYSGDDLNSNDDGDDSEPTFLPSDDSSNPGGDDIIFLPSDDSSGPGGDDIASYSSDDPSDTQDTTDVCVEDIMSDGACDAVNNNEQCGEFNSMCFSQSVSC